jgi:hypothetical protein
VAVAGVPDEGETAEVGWAELDDLSQVGLTDADEVREYTFEEADAATLAELGIVPDEAEQPAPTVAPAKSRRSRTRGAPKAEAATPAAEEPAAGEPRPKRSRTRSVSTSAPASPEPAVEPAAVIEAPKSRRRTTKVAAQAPAPAAKPRARQRTKPAEASEAGVDGEEGIWQRFRSGRTKPS